VRIAWAALPPSARKNLDAAMHGEAFAGLKYRSYAEAARKAGNQELARLFDVSADVESKEHFVQEADAAGLAGFEARNLADAMAGENYENTKMYIGFADEADKAGDKTPRSARQLRLAGYKAILPARRDSCEQLGFERFQAHQTDRTRSHADSEVVPVQSSKMEQRSGGLPGDGNSQQ